MCAKAIVDARLDYVYFGALEPKTGAVESIDHFFLRKDLNNNVYSSGGHMAKESSEMLKSFFRLKRSNR